jgi:uncharacterized protein (TIGR02246 family)
MPTASYPKGRRNSPDRLPLLHFKGFVAAPARPSTSVNGVGYWLSGSRTPVTRRGTRHHGKGAIAGGHQAILDTIYRGSTVRYDVVDQAVLTDGCLLGIVEATLEAPEGPLTGVSRSTITAVMTRTDTGWDINAFHNTLVAK